MTARDRAPRLIATGVALTTVLMVIFGLLLWLAGGLQPLPVSFGRSALGIGGLVVAPIAYAAMGAILAGRLARNPIGWLFLAAGVALGTMLPVNLIVGAAHQALRPAPPEVVAIAWLRNTFATPVVVTALVLAGALFPTGRPVGRRWSSAIWLTVIAGGSLALSAALDPDGLVSYPSIPNPTAVGPELVPIAMVVRILGVGLLVACAGLSVASLAMRYRRGDSRARAQLRWVIFAAGFAALATVPFLVSRYLLTVPELVGEFLAGTAQIGSSAFPIATAIAISRYRLFDIDVLLGRTLVYLPLTAILGGLYTASIAFFQRLFVAVTGETSDTAIVLTVLVVAAAFTPIRKALESLAERRFGPREPPERQPQALQGKPEPPSASPPSLVPSTLVAVWPNGSVQCPIRGATDVSRCLRCPYLRALVTRPDVAVVCSPPWSSPATRMPDAAARVPARVMPWSSASGNRSGSGSLACRAGSRDPR